MLKWAVVFLIIAIVAAVLGFGVLSGAAATIAEILFVVFSRSITRPRIVIIKSPLAQTRQLRCQQ